MFNGEDGRTKLMLKVNPICEVIKLLELVYQKWRNMKSSLQAIMSATVCREGKKTTIGATMCPLFNFFIFLFPQLLFNFYLPCVP